MSMRSKAWLLVPYGGEPFAVAEHVVMEYLGATQPHAVPLTPPHCHSAFFWRNRIVPLLDFGPLAGSDRATAMPKAVVLAYQSEPGTSLVYIAVALRESPIKIVVDDAMACALPPENKIPWRLLAISCFTRDGAATPIVSIARLDSAEFRLYAEAHCTEPSDDAAASTPPPLNNFLTGDTLTMVGPTGDGVGHSKDLSAWLDTDTNSGSDIHDDRDGDENENLDDMDELFEDEDLDEDLDGDDWADLEAEALDDDSTLDLEEDVDLDANLEREEDENLDDLDALFEDEDLDGDLDGDEQAEDLEALDDDSILDLEEDIDVDASSEWEDEDEEIDDDSTDTARISVGMVSTP